MRLVANKHNVVKVNNLYPSRDIKNWTNETAETLSKRIRNISI